MDNSFYGPLVLTIFLDSLDDAVIDDRAGGSIVFSPNELHLMLINSFTGTIDIWNLGELAPCLRLNIEPGVEAFFANDGMTLFTRTRHEIAKWRYPIGEKISSYSLPKQFQNPEGPVWWALSPTGVIQIVIHEELFTIATDLAHCTQLQNIAHEHGISPVTLTSMPNASPLLVGLAFNGQNTKTLAVLNLKDNRLLWQSQIPLDYYPITSPTGRFLLLYSSQSSDAGLAEVLVGAEFLTLNQFDIGGI